MADQESRITIEPGPQPPNIRTPRPPEGPTSRLDPPLSTPKSRNLPTKDDGDNADSVEATVLAGSGDPTGGGGGEEDAAQRYTGREAGSGDPTGGGGEDEKEAAPLSAAREAASGDPTGGGGGGGEKEEASPLSTAGEGSLLALSRHEGARDSLISAAGEKRTVAGRRRRREELENAESLISEDQELVNSENLISEDQELGHDENLIPEEQELGNAENLISTDELTAIMATHPLGEGHNWEEGGSEEFGEEWKNFEKSVFHIESEFTVEEAMEYVENFEGADLNGQEGNDPQEYVENFEGAELNGQEGNDPQEYVENFEGADLNGQEGNDPQLAGEFTHIAVHVPVNIPCWMSVEQHGSRHDQKSLGFLRAAAGKIAEGNLPDWDFIFLKNPAELLRNPGTQQVAAAALFFNSYPQNSKRYSAKTAPGYWRRSGKINDVEPDGFRFDYTYKLREESSQQRTMGLHEYCLQKERKDDNFSLCYIYHKKEKNVAVDEIVP